MWSCLLNSFTSVYQHSLRFLSSSFNLIFMCLYIYLEHRIRKINQRVPTPRAICGSWRRWKDTGHVFIWSTINKLPWHVIWLPCQYTASEWSTHWSRFYQTSEQATWSCNRKDCECLRELEVNARNQLTTYDIITLICGPACFN